MLKFDCLIPNANTQVTRKVYDDQGQWLHAAVTTLEFSIDGYPSERTDALGHEIRLFYDGNKDVERVEWWASSTTLPRAAVYTHDADGRLTSTTAACNQGDRDSTRPSTVRCATFCGRTEKGRFRSW